MIGNNAKAAGDKMPVNVGLHHLLGSVWRMTLSDFSNVHMIVLDELRTKMTDFFKVFV